MNEKEKHDSPEGSQNHEPNSEESLTEWQRKVLFHHRVRTGLGNERRYLGWLRASLTMVMLGFVVERMDLYLASLEGTGTDQLPKVLLWAPFVIYFMGVVTICVATWEFFADRRQFLAEKPRESRLIIILIVLILIFIVFIALLLWLPGGLKGL